MLNEEDRKWLYKKMQGAGIDTGDYNEFKSSLNNDEDLKWYYDKSRELGLDVGDEEAFRTAMRDQPATSQAPEAYVQNANGDLVPDNGGGQTTAGATQANGGAQRGRAAASAPQGASMRGATMIGGKQVRGVTNAMDRLMSIRQSTAPQNAGFSRPKVQQPKAQQAAQMAQRQQVKAAAQQEGMSKPQFENLDLSNRNTFKTDAQVKREIEESKKNAEEVAGLEKTYGADATIGNVTLGDAAKEAKNQAAQVEANANTMAYRTGGGQSSPENEFGVYGSIEAVGEAMRGNKQAQEQLASSAGAAQQMKDQLDYVNKTGRLMRDPMKETTGVDMGQFGYAPKVVRDENGEVIVSENGEPIVGLENDNVRANAQRKIEEDVDRDNIDNRIAAAQEELDGIEEQMREYRRLLDKVLGGGKLTAEEKARDISRADYEMLEQAARKSQALLRSLKLEKEGGAQGFLQALTDMFTNREFYGMGLGDLNEIGHLYSLKKRMESGGELTDADKRYISSMEAANAQEAKMDEGSTMWYRAGRQTAQMIPFWLQIGAMESALGGISSAGVKMGKEAAAKYLKKVGNDTASKRAAAWVIKNTGALMGDMAYGYAMAGTIGAPATAADILRRATGELTPDEEGNYHFEGAENWLSAAFKGLTANAAEYGTEKAGEHNLWGLGDLSRNAKRIGGELTKEIRGDLSRMVSKFGGFNRLSKMLGGLEGKVALNTANKFLNKFGIQDIGSEVGEEELNILINAVFTKDQSFEDFADARTQGDIILGMALSIGATKAPVTAGIGVANGVSRGINYAGYHWYKRATDKASNAARVAIGENWDALQEEIDNTPNEGMVGMFVNIMRNEGLSSQGKEAAIKYMTSLTKMRGYNQATINQAAAAQEAEAAGDAPAPATAEEELRSSVEIVVANANDEGYQTTEGDGMQDNENSYAMARQRVEAAFDEETLTMLDEDPSGAIALINDDSYWEQPFSAEAKAAASDYVEAAARRQGTMERVRDDIEAQVEASDRMVDERTDNEGNIRKAKLKNDKEVYVLDGQLIMTDDGTMVDVGASREANGDGMIIVRDVEGGEPHPVSLEEFLSVEAPINAAEEKRTAAESIRQTMAQAAADKMNGIVPPLQPGEMYELTDEQGNKIPIQVIEPVGEGLYHAVMDGIEYDALDIQGLADQMAGRRAEAAATTVERGSEAEADGSVDTIPAEETGLNAPIEGAMPIEEGAAPEGAAPVEDLSAAEASRQARVQRFENNDFSGATADEAQGWLYDEAQSGLTADEADAYVEARRKAADKEVSKLMDKAPKMGTNIADYKAKKAAWMEQVNKAGADARLWNDVKSRRERALANEVESVDAIPEETVQEGVQQGVQEAAQEEISEATAPTEEVQTNPLIEAYEREQGTIDAEGGLLQNDASERSLSPDWRGTLHALGRRIGKRVVILSPEDSREMGIDPKATNGFTIGNTIYLQEGAVGDEDSLLSFVTGHELTHILKKESPDLWSAYVESVKAVMGDKFGQEFQRLRNRYDRFYDKHNELNPDKPLEKLTDAEIEEEVCCDYAGNNILTDADAAQRIVEHAEQAGADPVSLTKKILDYIKGWIEKLKAAVKNGLDVGSRLEAMQRAKEVWQGMYDVAVAKRNQREEREKAAKAVEKSVPGSEVDAERGDVRLAVKDILQGEDLKEAVKDLMAVTGRSERTVRKWLKAEQSLAKIITDDNNVALLDLEVDESVPAIWNNSDYPQGTVEFSNICRKRLPFTMIYQRLQKEFPNTVFDASTLESIRGIMKERGLDVACGLCFVEDRRQLLGEIGQGFIDAVKGEKTDVNDAQQVILARLRESGETYVPDLYELLTLDGMKGLRKEHPAVAQAFVEYNNARGMQAGRLFQAYSAYHRDILDWTPAKVKSVNDNGGLRIFSFSDFEAHHLIDLVQVLTDCASKGVKVQGYTKVPEFAKAVMATGMKLNRSLIAKGKGYVDADYVPSAGEAVSPNVINGKRLLLDCVEGIDVTHPDFFDCTNNKNVGNILVGINDEQIRMAMADPFVDYIIPFHSGLKETIREQKGIGDWINYKLMQLEKKMGKKGKLVNADKHGVNIYTDVLPRGEELIGRPIANRRDFQEAFFKACEERGWVPRFAQFINTDKNGRYKYTPGYEKLLLDFKLFDKNGKIVPQEAVQPIFDDAYNAQILEDYVKGEKAKAGGEELNAAYDEIVDRLGLNEQVAGETSGRVDEHFREATKKNGVRFSLAGEKGAEGETEEERYAPRHVFETLTQRMLQMAEDNKNNLNAKIQAMRRIGGELKRLREAIDQNADFKTYGLLRSAMARQREYDQTTVDDVVGLARMLMDNNFIDQLSRGKVKRLLNIVRGAVGKEDITKSAEAVVDEMTNQLLHQWRDVLQKQLSVRASKVDSKGVEVQGRLDVEGQRMMKAAKEAMGLSQEQLAARMAEVNDRMGDDNEVIAKNAATEYEGLLIAKQYLEEIKASQEEEKELRHKLNQDIEDQRARKRGEGDEDPMENAAFRQYRESVEDAIRENKVARVEAYQRLVQRLGKKVETSMNRASEFAEKERERVRDIQHNANSDLEGIAADEQSVPTWFDKQQNNPLLRFFTQPLATFDQMMRFLGSKSVDGRGYLFNRFMPQYQKASDAEWRGLKQAHEELDAKVQEIFGGKVKRWSDLFAMERKMPKVTITVNDVKEQKDYDLSQGNMLYLYMVNKMTDGRMKLRYMGISAEDIEAMKEYIDPRFIALADWLQEEYLPSKRGKYNEVYERMFGAPMAAIDNYFPLKINSRSRAQQVDVGDESYLRDDTIASTITGSIIKRVKNVKPIDIHADAFDVVLEHLQDMEHWAAYAEANRDLGTLLSYSAFRNKVYNMSSARFGSGKVLWNNVKRTAAIVSGAYRPKVDSDSSDATIVNIAKGVTGAKIAFRVYTAAKQLLSYPAYLSEANILELVKTSNPWGAYKSWNWAMENLPGFARRWQSRQAGDNRLKETDVDWSFWKNKFVEVAGRLGMSPNAFVDALTVSMGAKAIYNTALKRYKSQGFSDQRAHEKALFDASLAYNETQQSSENAYLSAMQLDRTVASSMLTVFRNASMGYNRRNFSALDNLRRKMNPKYKEEAIAYMTKQLVRELKADHEQNGSGEWDEEAAERKARKAAEKMYGRSWFKDAADVLVFGYLLSFFWNLGPYAPYLLMGDDDDEKAGLLEDAAMHSLAGPIEGLSLGAQMSELYNLYRQLETSDKSSDTKNATWRLNNYNFNLLPLMSDIQQLISKSANGEMGAWNDVLNILVQSSVGVNPQTLTDAFVAIYDACDGDPKTSRELAFLLMRITQTPQSQIDMLYIDELGMFAHDAQGVPLDELARRWAKYKRMKDAPLSGMFASDEAITAKEEKLFKKFENKVKSRLEGMDEEELNEAFDNATSMHEKQLAGAQAAKKAGSTDTYGSTNSIGTVYGQTYAAMRTFEDMMGDAILLKEWKEAKGAGNVNRAAAIKQLRDELRKRAKMLGVGRDDEAIMEQIRTRRRQGMDNLNIEF